MSEQPRSRAGPYADAAGLLWAAGWRGILPLPHKRKKDPPHGYTGHDGAWPAWPDVQAWGEDGPRNVAIRLPRNVIGVDVDDYAGKIGATTIRLASERLGDLPPTWRSTSREQSVSGIYLYRVPDDLAWAGQVGADVEIIQSRHRYVVAPPSVHPNGGTYRWVRDDGTTSLAPPNVDDLPALPQAWVDAYGVQAGVRSAAGLDDAAIADWLEGSQGGPMCRYMAAAFVSCTDDLRSGARHDAALRATLRLVRCAQQGHSGVVEALRGYLALWQQVIADPARGSVRTPEAAQREWDDLLLSAVDMVASTPRERYDRCTYPLAGLLAPGPSRDDLQRLAERLDRSQASADTPALVYGAQIDAQRLVRAGLDVSLLLQVEQQTTHEQVRALAREIATERREGALSIPAGWALTDYREQVDDDEPWTVEQVLPAEGNVLLSAAYKAGKTTLVNHLAAQVVDAGRFLGRFAVLQRRTVAVWNYELHESMHRRWWQVIECENAADVHVLDLRGVRVPLTSPHGRDLAVEWLLARGIGVWIVDPFARAFTGESENDNGAVARFLDALDEIKAAAGVHELLLVAHTGRGEGAQERARGATRLDDWPDARWTLTRGEKDDEGARYFAANGRDVDVPQRLLRYDESTRSLALLDVGKGAVRPAQLQQALLAVVRSQPGIGLTQLRDRVRAAVGSASSDRIDAACDALASQGLLRIEREGPGLATKHYPNDPNQGLIR